MPKVKFEKEWNTLKEELLTEFVQNRKAFLETDDNTDEETYLHAYDEMYCHVLNRMDEQDGTYEFKNTLEDMKPRDYNDLR
ncbi:hypothetical protein ACOP1M_00155 [Staphylococcus warneri]|uniref:hypothetical protein n=1 Tax=Staphylococcus warneri TaxID=1292 RepID=UPI000D93D755|nr:hypothetical protein [Staphylococcus warneri]MCI2770663.1 hypothetical protein [Staphylococcus warneri]MCI2783382.1 hypothetical protein [Staphylococcus warneri]PXX85685.1 hypothetical protein DLY76_06580 [Staphylococcus warneri]